ncbi:LacI family DNA-binding transcriptional regulator [Pseudonocardia sp. GCM10023141]|uniref:LacI family DNA-binding transcriptional regulator n=1 Tax=Pseudonocardia sp. GCM10023141 TaxID=3252653 RepID=UPI003612DC94
MSRITSQDVARAAGVSQTTVSFVLNGRDQGISAQTRKAVLDAADRLGYVPSAAARSLRSGRSNVVLCTLPPLPVAQAIEEFKSHLTAALREAGYTCVFAQVGDVDGPLSDIWRHVHPAGVLSLGTLTAADAAALTRAGIPFIDGVLDPDRPAGNAIDQPAVGALQVHHLAERGHRRIGFGAVSDPLERPFCEPRLAGARRACAELGLPAPVVASLSYTRDSARKALATWTDPGAAVTAVAAFNDLVAVAVLASCRAVAVRVPDDLAIVGVDDLQVTTLVEPALSTVVLDLRSSARRLAGRLLWELPDAPSGVEQHDLPVSPLRLIQRESS